MVLLPVVLVVRRMARRVVLVLLPVARAAVVVRRTERRAVRVDGLEVALPGVVPVDPTLIRDLGRDPGRDRAPARSGGAGLLLTATAVAMIA